MFKTSLFTIRTDQDPFRYRGDEAAANARSVFQSVYGLVQTRTLPGTEDAAFSGCLELFFQESEAAVAAAAVDASPLLAQGIEVISKVVGMERTVVRAPDFSVQEKIKGVYPFCKKQGMSVQDFQKHWWHIHGPIAALTEEALGYVQIHPVPAYYDDMAPGYDGITEIYWPNAAAAARAIQSRQMTEDQGSDAPNFVDLESIALFLAEEEIIIEP